MKKLAAPYSFLVWLVLAVALILFSGPAQAYVYDDFTGSGINSSLWTDKGPNYGLFSQPDDGTLHFDNPYPYPAGGYADLMVSKSHLDMPFFVSMQFSEFKGHSNTEADFSGAAAQLWIGNLTKKVFVYRGTHDFYGQYFWAFLSDNGTPTHLTTLPVLTDVTSGWLGIGYDGAQASVWYDKGKGAGWQLLSTCNPGFTGDLFFGIRGFNGDNDYLSFQVNQVQVVPVPASVVLLGSGLLGLCGWRRLKKV